MAFSIRRATTDDIEIVIELIAQARRWQEEAGQPAAFATDRRRETIASVESNSCYIGIKNGETVATFSLEREDTNVWPNNPEPSRYLHRLVVRPDMHNHGLGAACMAYAERLAIAEGATFLCLDAVEDNKVLCSWYERQGYERVGSVKLPNWKRASTLFRKRLDN